MFLKKDRQKNKLVEEHAPGWNWKGSEVDTPFVTSQRGLHPELIDLGRTLPRVEQVEGLQVWDLLISG